MPLSDIGSPFFLKNLFKGLLFVAIIIIVYLIAGEFIDMEAYMEILGQWPIAIYLTFTFSEIIFGLIPPELFIIWVIDHGVFELFIPDVALLAGISFAAGLAGYSLGKSARNWSAIESFMEKYVYKYKSYFRRYGGFLIVIGALTPLPFSAVCMLMGASAYPYSRFLLITSIRFLRFALYGWVIWKTIAI